MKNKAMWFIAPIIVALMVFVGAAGNASAFTRLNTQLDFGARGAEVTNLQTFLASNSNVYPQDLITGYFGTLTRDAVAQFQIGYNMSPVGRVGPQTLLTINGLVDSGKNIDVSAPMISGTKVVVSGRTAYVSWNSNEPVRSKVFYNTSQIALTESNSAKSEPTITGAVSIDSTFSTSKNIVLSNLQSLTTYYYVIEAIDDAGNVSVTLPQVFVTSQ